MKGYYPYPTRDAVKNYFPLPNEVFSLGLSAGEISVYGFLMRCEDRRTHQCHPSYKTIGKAVRLSPNTVRKHVNALREKRLILTERTEVTTRNGEKRNGNLLYTIRPMEEAIRYHIEQQFRMAEEEQARQRVQKRLNQLERKSTPEK